MRTCPPRPGKAVPCSEGCCVAGASLLTDAGEEDPSLIDGLPSLCVKADDYLEIPKFVCLGKDALHPQPGGGPVPSTPIFTLLSLTSVLARLMLNLRTIPSSSGHRVPLGAGPTSARPRANTSTLTPSVCFTPKATAPAGAALQAPRSIFRGLHIRHPKTTNSHYDSALHPKHRLASPCSPLPLFYLSSQPGNV